MHLPSLLDAHLAADRLLDRDPPWEIRYCDEQYERGVFATRHIEPGQVIFRDSPLILGPRTSASQFFCVNCYGAEAVLACSKGCGLPVCSQACESSERHRRECGLIVEWRGELVGDEVDRCVFRCLAAIRGLFVDGQGEELLRTLKGHHGQVHGKEVDMLENVLLMNIGDSQDRLMRLACAVMDTNAFEVALGSKGNSPTLRGLYPLSSLMNHRCVPNTTHIFDSRQIMVVKATVPIPKDAQIFTTYVRLTWSTPIRRTNLLATKHFFCRCPRCEDRTECGTDTNALYCFNCKGTALARYFGTSTDPIWECVDCEATMEQYKVRAVMLMLGNKLAGIARSGKVEDMLVFLERFLPQFAPVTSQIGVELKYRIVWTLGYAQGYGYEELSQRLLNIKKKLCEDLLEYLHSLESGKSRVRALLLYELYSCIREQYKRNHNEESAELLPYLIEEVKEILKDDVNAPEDILT